MHSHSLKVALKQPFETDATPQSKQQRPDHTDRHRQTLHAADTMPGIIGSANDDDLHRWLAERTGRLHLRQRLGLESDHHALVSDHHRKWFHIENWRAFPWLVKSCLQLTLLYRRARDNALRIQLHHNRVVIEHLPAAFDGFKILHLSDLHADMNAEFAAVLSDRVRDLEYDICVLTGDYRYRTYGPCDATLAALAAVRPALQQPVYGILGNHDSIRMVPAMETMGYRMLVNEAVTLQRGDAVLHLIGIDDPHYFRTDNLDRACRAIDHDDVSVLLAHTPEVYRHAAHAGIDFMLCGHTHGGQICLPGGIPLIFEANCPRRFVAGAWRYNDLQGYTSVGAGSSIVDVRLNCLPEVTIHELRRSAD
jgi:predicted MPP superfamily phosphohydrolase